MLDENPSESTCVLVEWNHIISSFISKEGNKIIPCLQYSGN